MITIGMTYEIVTPESAERGEADEYGWHLEKQEWCPGLLHEYLEHMEGCQVEASSSEIDEHTWWTAYRANDGTREYYETGAELSLSLHVEGATLSTMKRIDKLLTV